MIDQSALLSLFVFNFQTGEMFWREREDVSPQWNGRYAGTKAFTAKRCGYLHGSIGGKLYQAHRVIYAAAHGVWPDLIDHINQDRSDNRLTNLRPANKQTNSHNSKIRSDNKSGVRGVGWSGRQSAYRAYITINGKQKHLGFFSQKSDAVSARKLAEKIMEPR